MSSKGEGGPSDSQRVSEHGLRGMGQVTFLDQALWKRFAAAETSEAFLNSWLALQCRLIAGATCGVLVLGEPDQGPFAPAAAWPDNEPISPRLSKAVEQAAAQRRSVFQGESGKSPINQPEECLVAYPLLIQG